MIFFLILGIVCSLIGLLYLVIAIMSLNPKNRISVPGKLVAKKGYKNYKIRGNASYPWATEYTYVYEVNGKKYKLKQVDYVNPRAVLDRSVIIYLRGFPWVAYEKRFYGDREWLFGIFYTAMGIASFYLAYMVK